MAGKIIVVLIGMSLVTYLPRVLPIVMLSKMDLPQWFLAWLKYVPVAVLAALLAPILLVHQGRVDLAVSNRELLASIPCFLVAGKTRNLFLTVVVGMAGMMVLNILT